ncbi:hypothetical protein Aduo_011102 [Ancylostoma duodenale]
MECNGYSADWISNVRHLGKEGWVKWWRRGGGAGDAERDGQTRGRRSDDEQWGIREISGRKEWRSRRANSFKCSFAVIFCEDVTLFA